MKSYLVVLMSTLVLSGAALAKEANDNSVKQQTVASPKPPTLSSATVVSPVSQAAKVPVTSPRVGPNTTGVISATGFDESLDR